MELILGHTFSVTLFRKDSLTNTVLLPNFSASKIGQLDLDSEIFGNLFQILLTQDLTSATLASGKAYHSCFQISRCPSPCKIWERFSLSDFYPTLVMELVLCQRGQTSTSDGAGRASGKPCLILSQPSQAVAWRETERKGITIYFILSLIPLAQSPWHWSSTCQSKYRHGPL